MSGCGPQRDTQWSRGGDFEAGAFGVLPRWKGCHGAVSFGEKAGALGKRDTICSGAIWLMATMYDMAGACMVPAEATIAAAAAAGETKPRAVEPIEKRAPWTSGLADRRFSSDVGNPYFSCLRRRSWRSFHNPALDQFARSVKTRAISSSEGGSSSKDDGAVGLCVVCNLQAIKPKVANPRYRRH